MSCIITPACKFFGKKEEKQEVGKKVTQQLQQQELREHEKYLTITH